jgi:ribosome maturation factor RimP
LIGGGPKRQSHPASNQGHMNLKQIFEARKGQELHLRLQNGAEIDGKVVFVGDDSIGVETNQGTTMIVPFNAIAFTRAPTASISELLNPK